MEVNGKAFRIPPDARSGSYPASVHVVFTDRRLAEACNTKEQLKARWGPLAGGVELALSCLSASSSLRAFLALPTVTRGKDMVSFTTAIARVRLSLAEIQGDDDQETIIVARIEAVRRTGRSQ
jgi:hypothetical protein